MDVKKLTFFIGHFDVCLISQKTEFLLIWRVKLSKIGVFSLIDPVQGKCIFVPTLATPTMVSNGDTEVSKLLQTASVIRSFNSRHAHPSAPLSTGFVEEGDLVEEVHPSASDCVFDTIIENCSSHCFLVVAKKLKGIQCIASVIRSNYIVSPSGIEDNEPVAPAVHPLLVVGDLDVDAPCP